MFKHLRLDISCSLASSDGTSTVSGDDSDLVHYSTKFILLGLNVSSTARPHPRHIEGGSSSQALWTIAAKV